MHLRDLLCEKGGSNNTTDSVSAGEIDNVGNIEKDVEKNFSPHQIFFKNVGSLAWNPE
jgi:hypothetical protein